MDTKDNYVEATLPHVAGDHVVDDKAHLKAQREANAHATMWVRFTRGCKN